MVAVKLVHRPRASFSLGWKASGSSPGWDLAGNQWVTELRHHRKDAQVRHLDGTAVLVQRDIQETGDLCPQAALEPCEHMQGKVPVGILFIQVMLVIATTSSREHTWPSRLCVPKTDQSLEADLLISSLFQMNPTHRRHQSIPDSQIRS